MEANAGCQWVPAAGKVVRKALHLLGGRVGGEHQVLNWPSQLLTEEGVLHPYNLWLVLQSFLQGQESADELPDRDPGLESAEGGPE